MAMNAMTQPIEEAVEAVDAADADQVVEVVDASDDRGEARADDGINVYTAMMIASTVAFAAATFVALLWLRDYCDQSKWLW